MTTVGSDCGSPFSPATTPWPWLRYGMTTCLAFSCAMIRSPRVGSACAAGAATPTIRATRAMMRDLRIAISFQRGLVVAEDASTRPTAVQRPAEMEFRVLGPLEVADEGRVLPLGSGRQLALFAFLLLHANEAVSVDRLVDELWGDSPPSTAPKIVRNSVSLLRRELGDRLESRPPGYLLRVQEGELDSDVLERAVESGELEELTAALGRWRGSPLSQLAYESFAQSEITRLEELRLSAVEARIEAELELGRHGNVVGELERLLRQHPLRERLSGLL